mmetsp:Transcript_21841/g.51908  ORF Transcript_21841/g.51908 Transcript_21841/m.51908 type:complete len:215 (+) Transcript_21841:130-774(+)
MGRALPRAGLQHVELALLDCKLDVLHVPVMVLQLVPNVFQLAEDPGHHLLQRRQVAAMGLASLDRQLLGCSDAGHNVLTLGVDQELSVEILGAVGRIAGEGNSRGAVVAHVAEDHRLNVHGRAPLLRDVMQLPVGLGPLVHPGTKNSAHSAPELLLWILRELLPELQINTGLVVLDQLLQVLWLELVVLRHTSLLLGPLQKLLEVVQLDAKHHI